MDTTKRTISRRKLLAIGGGASAALLSRRVRGAAEAQQSLNLLAWIGYQEQDLLRPFEQQHGVRLNVKTYVGGDQMFALFAASKGVYDVVLMDPEYVQKLQPMGRLTELNASDYDFAGYLPLFKRYPPTWIDNKMWAVTIRYGFNGLVFNTKKISPDSARSYKILWDPALKGRIGIWDWYLPSMGALSRALGHKNPYALTNAEFDQLVERMVALRPSVGAIFPDFSTMLASLANEQIWIVPSGGDWVAAALKHQGHPIDWTIPDEGGIIWSECLTIPTDSRNPELAKKYIQYMMSGRAQALLTWRKANTSQIPNTNGWQHMTERQRAALLITTEDAAMSLLSRAFVRQLPSNPPEARWQEAWQKFKAGV